MFLASRRADLLERSLHEPGCTDREILDLVATADQVPALTSAACAPREEFVSALALKLHDEAMRMPRTASLTLPNDKQLDATTGTVITKRFEVLLRLILRPELFPWRTAGFRKCEEVNRHVTTEKTGD